MQALYFTRVMRAGGKTDVAALNLMTPFNTQGPFFYGCNNLSHHLLVGVNIKEKWQGVIML